MYGSIKAEKPRDAIIRATRRNYLRRVPKLRVSVILSEGLLQAEAKEYFAGDNGHGKHEF